MRYIDIKDWDLHALATQETTVTSFGGLFNEETGQIQSLLKMNRNDLEIVKAIKEKKINVSSFDFDGVKHTVKDCDAVIAQLENEIAAQLQRQQSLDKDAFLFFLHREEVSDTRTGAPAASILENYSRFKTLFIQYEEYVALVNRLMKRIQPFYSGGITLEEVNAIIADIKSDFEPALKKVYGQLQEEGVITQEENAALAGKIRDFCGKNYFYFVSNEFQNNELNDLTGLAIQVAEELNRYEFKWYKKMLTEQATPNDRPAEQST